MIGENGTPETPDWSPDPRPWACDFCRKPATKMVGESNEMLACDDHARPLQWAASQKCEDADCVCTSALGPDAHLCRGEN